ncbi:hypothetical protein WJX75_004264 [Coccomyxa subellipsoidea]|uniref:Uncharacterized protein n=1 Tax=Coccomyxa subellipsoidea TaxID=248742 RepID=A0ABR2YD34_9CHLO
MLFNFSKPVASFTADDLIVTGGSAFEVIPVQHTNDYFVWLAVHPGAGSFSVVIKSGTVTDAAGNILYSDPTAPTSFTVLSDNGQYTAPPPPPPGIVSSSLEVQSARASGMLSKGAIIGLVVGLVGGLLLAALATTICYWLLRKRSGSYQRNYADAVAADLQKGGKSTPKTVHFTA